MQNTGMKSNVAEDTNFDNKENFEGGETQGALTASLGEVAHGAGQDIDKKPSFDETSGSGVVSNIREGAANLRSRAGDVSGRAQEAFSHVSGRAQETFSDVASRAQEFGGRALDQTSTFIRRYPSQSLFAGFGLGILLGYALSRR